ncbi:uncharacterized protein LOC129610362 [Condylostylus longicornis]|uniref:uncharacterized protein LOC129610362 n=1 Tax=Condylostylus longicornis TaxID=2530218 RepID=UPI00244E35F2|nr:uncharacterized protein LOC129610362 [Condylostylus longicornis]
MTKPNNNVYNPNDDLIVRSLRNFGLSYLNVRRDNASVAYDEMRKEFMANGSEPIDFTTETHLKPVETIPETLHLEKNKKTAKHCATGSPTYFKKFPHEIKKRERCNSDRTRLNQSFMENRCVFCSNNNEPLEVVKSHSVRDVFGRVLCPKLRTYICPICNCSGDLAHTVKYCPKKPVITMEDAIMLENLKYSDIPKRYEKFR